MKLGNDVLIEIVDIVRDGIANGKDVSEALRNLDLTQDVVLADTYENQRLVLSNSYKSSKGRVV